MAYGSKNMQTSDFFNAYISNNVNNICRICLEKGAKLMPIFDPVKPPHFSILLMACASVQVIEGDGFPPYICQKCISKLNIAYQFKMQCESSDAKLRSCFSALHAELSSYVEIKHNVTNEYENSANTIIETHEIIADDPHIYLEKNDAELQTLQTIQLVPGPSLPEIGKDEVFEEFKIEISELKNDLNVKLENSLKNPPPEMKAPASPKAKTQKSTKQHQCDTCGKVFRTKPGLVHHIRIHTGERPYVCHLCDKRFINGGHLHTHMRTHTGEKNHVCAACGKAFATSQQLTKHTIAIHTSERPYGCTYCTKRFASSSNLNTHIKIHTGEKNFHCDQCTKTFSTKGQLLQHLLVHTGEKAYLCEFCNKRFAQKAHLVRHLKMHRN